MLLLHQPVESQELEPFREDLPQRLAGGGQESLCYPSSNEKATMLEQSNIFKHWIQATNQTKYHSQQQLTENIGLYKYQDKFKS